MPLCDNHDRNMGYIEALKDAVPRIEKATSLLQKDVEYLRRDQERILARFGKHVEDAEKEGGRHERLNNAENAIKDIQRTQKWLAVASGVIGGLIGSGAPEAVKGLAKILGV